MKRTHGPSSAAVSAALMNASNSSIYGHRNKPEGRPGYRRRKSFHMVTTRVFRSAVSFS
jgi:hypothetical protein